MLYLKSYYLHIVILCYPMLSFVILCDNLLPFLPFLPLLPFCYHCYHSVTILLSVLPFCYFSVTTVSIVSIVTICQHFVILCYPLLSYVILNVILCYPLLSYVILLSPYCYLHIVVSILLSILHKYYRNILQKYICSNCSKELANRHSLCRHKKKHCKRTVHNSLQNNADLVELKIQNDNKMLTKVTIVTKF